MQEERSEDQPTPLENSVQPQSHTKHFSFLSIKKFLNRDHKAPRHQKVVSREQPLELQTTLPQTPEPQELPQDQFRQDVLFRSPHPYPYSSDDIEQWVEEPANIEVVDREVASHTHEESHKDTTEVGDSA